jgi:P-type E1-E2 ATPase
VVSCPCALGLAAPLARVVAAGALARCGIVARGEGALDHVAAAGLIAFDKTGTLTAGRPALAELATWGASPGEALAALAGLEERAGHPIAAAVREALPPGLQPAPAAE